MTELNLSVIPYEGEKYSSFQKCFLPKEYFPKTAFPGNVVLCKFKNSKILSICRIYPMNNNEKRNYCEIDQSVDYYVQCQPNLMNYIGKNTSIKKGINLLDVQIVQEPNLINFSSIEVEVYVGVFNGHLMSEEEYFCNLIKDILKCYTFTNNSVITCKRLNVFDFGIRTIIIKNTDIKGFGTIKQTGNIKIIKTFFGANIQYTELGGMEEYYNELSNIINYNQMRMQDINRSQWKIGNQILLSGPSGSGKSSLIHNLAIEKCCNVFDINGAQIVRPEPGEAEAVLRELFKNAFDFALCQSQHLALILMEDIDIICPELSSSNENSFLSRISSQIFSLLDEVNKKSKGVILIATTSNIELVNLSLRRPGRLETEIYISMPSAIQRSSILEIILKNQFNDEEDKENGKTLYKFNKKEISDLVSIKTAGFVGSDLLLLIVNVVQQMIKLKLDPTKVVTEKMLLYFKNGLKSVRPSCLRESINVIDSTGLFIDEIGGLNDLKKMLNTCVLAPLKNPESFKRFNMDPPKGILLYGPPGCAKTTIAKYLAVKSHMTFLSISSAEIYSSFVGDAEKFIRKIFNQARMSAPAIIFLDEIDSLVGNRTKGGVSDVQSRVISTLLTEMDGIGLKVESSSNASSKTILVIGATNRPDMIDDALMRPGRFDKLIHVEAPDSDGRFDILKIITKKMPIDDTVNLSMLRDNTINFSGADLCNLCNEAALHALSTNIDIALISQEHFEYALNMMRPSLSKSQIQFYYDFETLLKN